MKFQTLTKEEVLNDEYKDYNPQEWTRIVNRYDKFTDVKYYKWCKEDSPYDYDQMFIEYTTEEGIRFLNRLSYSFSLTNGGFARVYVSVYDGEVIIGEFEDASGKKGRLANNPRNRDYMARLTANQGITFTTCL